MENFIFESADTIGRFTRLYMNTKRDLPIRASEMGMLIYIYKQEEPITPLKLSEFFKIAKPSVTASVNALLKNDYLEKNYLLQDKRSYELSVTKKGIDLVDTTFKDYFFVLKDLQRKMGNEAFNEMIKLLDIANTILEEMR